MKVRAGFCWFVVSYPKYYARGGMLLLDGSVACGRQWSPRGGGSKTTASQCRFSEPSGLKWSVTTLPEVE